MSAYMELATPMTSRECLLDALADVGFTAGKVEVHPEQAALVGYDGSAREQRAEIIIRKAHVGASSNDVGFAATPTGYRLIVSGFDGFRFGTIWLAQVSARYEYHRHVREQRLAAEERRRLEEERRRLVEAQRQSVLDAAKKQGYRIQEVREGEAVRLVLTKRVY